MDDAKRTVVKPVEETDEVSKFAESYASFNRVINSLQRKYLELENEFSRQNEKLVQANKKLVELTQRNLATTVFLNGILNSLSAGVITVDLNGRVTHFNPAASVVLGISAEEVLGKPYRDLIPPGEPVYANALRTAESGREVSSVEKVISRKDGTSLVLSVSTALLKDDEGKAIGAVEVFQDLTKIKKMEQELARLNTLAALGEMAATIAHQVRNPLSGIIGFASLLEKELEPSDPRRRLTEKIIRGVNTLNETVTTLLNYAKLEDVNKSEIVYYDFLKNVVEQFKEEQGEAMARIHLHLHEPAHPKESALSVVLDRVLMRQALHNILANACQAVKPDGKVEVRFRLLPQDEAAARYGERILLGTDETLVETVVSDNGPGVPEEHIERIFAPFFTTSKEGNGLGLAVAWKVMKAHGGDIVAENSAEGGAVFRLLVPVKIDRKVRERTI